MLDIDRSNHSIPTAQRCSCHKDLLLACALNRQGGMSRVIGSSSDFPRERYWAVIFADHAFFDRSYAASFYTVTRNLGTSLDNFDLTPKITSVRSHIICLQIVSQRNRANFTDFNYGAFHDIVLCIISRDAATTYRLACRKCYKSTRSCTPQPRH
jgi:hypothetical protein